MHSSGLFWSALVRAPMVRLATPFIMGISVAYVTHPGLIPVLVLCIVTSLALVFALRSKARYEQRWRRGVLFACWTFVFGVFWYTLRDPNSDPENISSIADLTGQWTVNITEVTGISKALLRAEGEIQAHTTEEEWKECSGKLMISLLRGEDGATVMAGDRLVLVGEVTPIERVPDPGGFDRKAWAGSRGMDYEIFAPRDDWSVTGHIATWTDGFSSLRKHVSKWIDESAVPTRERALVKALVLGLRDELTSEQRTSFIRSGTIHVLAVSGTHVGFIYGMLFILFRWSGESRKVRLIRGTFIILALWGYAGLTGGSPSVLRATIMFSFFTLADMFARQNNSLNSLFTAAFLLLIIDPHMLVEIGFQLSFLAVLGIILFMRPIEILWSPDNWLLRKVWSLVAVSLAAQTLTTPLSIYLFGGFPTWFIPANLIVVTAAGFAVYGSVLLLLLYKVPVIGAAITWVLTRLLMGVGITTEFFAQLPYAYPPMRVSLMEMILLYVIIVAFMSAWILRWRQGLIIGSLSVAAVFVSIGIRIERSHELDQFTIYDDRGALHAALSTGRSLVVLSDTNGTEDRTWIKSKVARHERVLGARSVEWIDMDRVQENVSRTGNSLIGNGYWCSSQIEVLFFSQNDHMVQEPEVSAVDAIVIHDTKHLAEEDLELISERTDQVVLAGDLPWKLRSFVKRWSEENGLKLHDVREDGAFIFSRRSVDE
ncbi:MAG: ComEC/Rec2 family competence protein [Flavobacteriales bacterium]|nr:ComEC/Rec2 family competence protein [Flavobacteriales bacterium]MBK7239074.1 ComEC/Rec2 family competence protein [Flavobacteriales bacterium]MBK9536821.1 ComEC/Rec2 family competence protein [Flavobacteriales bacterium]MBP9138155.1 ComEC/Rec2 family competence protein [Flavobacteriales bacterium]HQV52490.1 ComEC/Rec2 family competence protein [Flavobacteriales bacterium]